MIRRLLKAIGLQIVYVCEWGTYTRRYDGIDYTMQRPIHSDMSVAPPWAKLRIKKATGQEEA